MLTILNRYAHGFVAVPVIDACRKHGLFDALQGRKSVPVSDLVQKLHANSGALEAALRMLESLSWVSRNNTNRYRLTSRAEVRHKIPQDIMQLMSFPMADYLAANPEKSSLEKWIRLSCRRWDMSDPLIADFLDGMLVIPLLLSFLEKDVSNSGLEKPISAFATLTASVRNEVEELFFSRGWLQQESPGSLTDTGRFICERIFITASVASYRPMLMNMSDLIFGDAKPIFERTPYGHERHIERSLNVVGSGFQHQKYFSDLDEIIISLFDNKSYAEQPKYIADMGCGDGSLLKNIYGLIRDKCSRGKVLDKFPLKLIAVDFNKKALDEAGRNLQGIDHLTLTGDIGNPEKMIRDFRSLGIEDTENILHVRSFLDHDRPYLPPSEKVGTNRPDFRTDAVYLDKEGNSIPPVCVTQSLVEHFKRWSPVVGKHGLIMLEVHCLSCGVVRDFLDKTESLHFDAYHSFSQQLLVEAPRFLIAAAEAGLFPGKGLRKYPKMLPFTRITLLHFEKRDYCIRYAQEKDLPALRHLESVCWKEGLRSPSSVLQRRIRRYPQGQLVLEMDGVVVGVIYSQRIADKAALEDASVDSVEKLHADRGAFVQLLGINIDPRVQERQLGGRLLDFMQQHVSMLPGVQSVVGITRCRDYNNHPSMSMLDYVRRRDEQGRLADPILCFHERHGARIGDLVPQYRPKDEINDGFGVLVEYDIHNREHQAGASRDNSRGESVDVVDERCSAQQVATSEEVEPFLQSVIGKLLGEARARNFSVVRPLMEMGLDSADLLELTEQMSLRFQATFEPTFLFQHNTVRKIVAYFSAQMSGREPAKAGPEIRAYEVKPPASIDRPEPADVVTRTKKVHPVARIPSGDDIAITGMACRLPGGLDTVEELWEFIRQGKSAIGNLPAARWQWPAEIDVGERHRGIDRGGFLKDIDCFDASFFRLSPREAKVTDPQQRILLELAWETLEGCGYSADALAGSRTGVFIGASGSDYRLLLERNGIKIEANVGTGNSMAVLANRLSYFFDFHGPSLQIDTACSSSLVAVHEAVQALRAGICSQALVGGVNVICHPGNTIAYYEAGMLSPDGLCHTFDDHANGYVRSEGAVTLMLKPLAQAIVDRDPIHALIKGTGCNHGGQAGGLTVPNPEWQAKLLKEAWEAAQVHPASIGYIEVHGTGTKLGDPIEVRGLKEAFLSSSERAYPENSCALSSIKSNLGHLEAGAGIAGLLKVVLSLKYQQIAPSINFERLNSKIELGDSPFYIAHQVQDWQQPTNEKVSGFPEEQVLAALVPEGLMLMRSWKNTRKAPNRAPACLSPCCSRFRPKTAGVCRFTLKAS